MTSSSQQQTHINWARGQGKYNPHTDQGPVRL